MDSSSNQIQISETKSTLSSEQILPTNSKETAALENIFHDTVYFLIKSGNEENVSLAKAKVKKFFFSKNFIMIYF